MSKQCEVCQIEIPDEFVNALCYSCYDKQTEENEELTKREEQERQQEFNQEKTEPQVKSETVFIPSEQSDSTSSAVAMDIKSGITDPNYQENPEMEDKPQWQANLALFQHNSMLLWKPTRQMYTYIRDYCREKIQQHPQWPKFIWRPKIVDVGCGIGAGSNVLSEEADFVWGIDKNEKTIKFAQEAFTRNRNGIYYSSQLTFDIIDIMVDTRQFLKFDVVVAIEVIEHIHDYKGFLKQLLRFDKGKTGYEATEYFISTPNRNNKSISKDRPKNIYHCREFTSEEYFDVLSEFFNQIEFFAADGKPTEKMTTHTPLLAKVSNPK